VTTHYLEEAEYCGRLALIHAGRMILTGSPREIKATFPYPILDIQCSPLVRALSLLGEDASRGDLSVWADSLHVVLKDGEESRLRVLRILSDGGVEVTRERNVRPTLEDVFVLRTSGTEQDRTHL